MLMEDTDRRQESQLEARAKKPYTRPGLTEYGSVAKLTMVKGTTSPEGGPNKLKCL